ncbi:MAG: methyltransferase, partial [Anderseniella sp.]|nr:methyltransferase [Anderseniella sp.]
MWTMFSARTNILPHRAADRLVTHGPFALTRNPIYVGNTIAMLG